MLYCFYENRPGGGSERLNENKRRICLPAPLRKEMIV